MRRSPNGMGYGAFVHYLLTSVMNERFMVAAIRKLQDGQKIPANLNIDASETDRETYRGWLSLDLGHRQCLRWGLNGLSRP